MTLRDLSRLASELLELASMERESTVPATVRRRLWLWRRGFVSRSDTLYNLEEESVDGYVSDFQRVVQTGQINGQWSVVLSNTLLFHWMIQQFDANQMAVHGLIRNGTYYEIDAVPDSRKVTDGGTTIAASLSTDKETGTSLDFAETTPQQTGPQRVVDRLQTETNLVLKPVAENGADDVFLCSKTTDAYRVNDRRYTPAEFRSLVAGLDEYLICEYVEQCSFSARRYPETPNTIRFVTMVDEATGEPFIAAALFQIGTADSAPLETFSAGSLSAAIDTTTGELGPGAQKQSDGSVSWHSNHPDTGVRIAGTQIPGWEHIRNRLLEMANACSVVPYIGWNCIVTDHDGGFTVVEANDNPELEAVQVHGPLLADDRVRRFYERYDIC